MSENQKTILIAESKTSPQMKLTPEIRESILTLPHHPGFKYLMQTLALQKQYMRELLETTPDISIRMVDRLQNGIYWTNWLDRRIFKLASVEPPQPPARQLRKSEAELLEEIRKNIIVGEGEDSAYKP